MSAVPVPARLVPVSEQARMAATVFLLIICTILLTAFAISAHDAQTRGAHFGDGVYRVAPTGADLAPGVYATAGAPGSMCRWSITDEATGQPSGYGEDAPPVALRLDAGSVLSVTGCGTWQEVR